MPKTRVRHNNGKQELFSPDTLRESVLHSATANKVPAGQAEEIANKAVQHVEKWLQGRTMVTPQDIRRVAAKAVEPLHPGLGFFYASGNHII
ncbi:MAG: hypothetical protein LBL84_02140 [Candidatus Nomurabacteria bacterium]|jgi:hypothetical protein|nr:hypothetical protein [Candidatus Nomurabacteria bacterium]